MGSVENLAAFRRCTDRICSSWTGFQSIRLERLREQERFGHAAERATEAIVEDLFTMVLDWSVADLNHQVGYADILLTRLGIKYLIVETKRPGALAWNRAAVASALEQACRYAAEQRVRCVAVTDGHMLYAADVRGGGTCDRVFCSLVETEPPKSLWWLSLDGIYRERTGNGDAMLQLLPDPAGVHDDATESEEGLLHPRYGLPARCFAYAGDASDPRTWHLPYLAGDGTVDGRRLPKAVQAILSNYRGAHVTTVPEQAIPDVLARLEEAARTAGKMPDQCANPSPAYVQLAAALEQIRPA